MTDGDPDRAALVALYEATDGPNWVNSENWLTDAPLGEWFGVETDSLGRVVRLEMTHYDWDRREWIVNNLSGPLPAQLGDLAKLERMDFRSNNLTGPIPPELASLANLERMDLGSNSLAGPIPAELGGLVNLARLSLGDNELSGPIPPELGGLDHLTFLNLGSNQLTGAIPPAFGNFAELEQLYLDNNGLTGAIPTQLASLTKLARLYLHSNGLVGPIPATLGALTNLERLYLDSNRLTGSIPSELGSLADLERLHLSRNDLGGPVPASLASLDSLESLTVSGNDVCVPRSDSVFVAWLAGTDHDLTDLRSCPSDREVLVALYDAMGGPGWTDATNWLTEEPLGSWHGVTVDSAGRLTHLDLSQNGLTGTIAPELADLFGLRELLLDRNELTGTIPRELGLLSGLTRLSLHTNRLRGAVPAELSRLRTLEHLRVANNALCVRRSVAVVADWLAGVDHDAADLSSCPSDREVLEALHNATDGPNWRNSDNWLTDAPLEEWWGVETDAYGQVVRLKLGGAYVDGQYMSQSQGLAGELPPELGGLTQLVELTIAGNDLTGSIPPELGDLSNLERLDLGWNELSGVIPPELGGLPNLERLELGVNQLSGAIPPELGGLSNLTRLDLGWNELSGAMPPELGGLSNLVRLDLESNDLTGSIPVRFSGLGRLRRLTLDAHHCAPADPQLQAWLRERDFHPIPCEVDQEPPTVADPYPIRLHWALCRHRGITRVPERSDCVLVDDARAEYGNMIVDAMEDVAAEWGRVLSPTARTSWVAPVDGWHRETPPHLWGLTPGDTVPPGLDVLVAGTREEEVCGLTCATGSPVRQPGGYDGLVRMLHVVVDSRYTLPYEQRRTSMHEIGHAIAMSGSGRREWSDHVVKLPLDSIQREVLGADSIWVQTHPEIIRVYELYGGGQWNWIGKDVGVAMDVNGWSHWHDCSAPQDMMAGSSYFPIANSVWQWPTRISPLTATAARIHGGFEVDMQQVGSADYNVSHYWRGDIPNRTAEECQALTVRSND